MKRAYNAHRWTSLALLTVVVSVVLACGCAYAASGNYPALGALTGSKVYDVAVEGTYAYLVGVNDTNNYIVRVVDISDPTAPAEVSRLTTPGGARAVAVAGDYLYVASYTGGLRVIDVSGPADPVEVAHCGPTTMAIDVAVVGSHVYVVDHQDGVFVIDVSDPTTPTVVGSCNPNGNEQCVAVAEPYAYVGYEYGALGVMDVSNPAAPYLRSYLPQAGEARGVAVADGYAYVAKYTGLYVTDVSDPAHPTALAQWADTDPAFAVAVANGYCYVAAGGLHVLDVTTPSDPIEVAFSDDLTVYQNSVAVADGYVYLGCSLGLLIYPEASFSASRLRGQVRIAGTSTALDGVTVEAYQGGAVQGWAITRNGGQYAIPGLAAGAYTVVAHQHGYVTQTVDDVAVATDQTTTLNVDLVASGRLKGQVRKRGTTTNLVNASVVAYLNGEAQASATTDSRGIYTIEDDLPAGEYVVITTQAGYLAQTKAHISVAASATTYVNFALLLETRLAGQVTARATGAPLIGATVSVWDGATFVAETVTQSPWGVYRFDALHLAPGTYIVRAASAGYVTQSKWNVLVTEVDTTYRNFSLTGE